jgi:LuxR family transcriptional activator of conjugal transfer of Ti plasmids
VVSFVTDQKPQALRKTIQEHRDTLHLASIYFHVHARQKLERVIVPDRPHLSPREIACLQWVVRGKSTWDISEILTISRRTVVFHLENAKRKLNSVTLPQAVSIALQNRLIEF